jgi:hypothetical protein
MKYLLFGGAERVGKSQGIYRLTNFLIGIGFVDTLGLVPPSFKDFTAVLTGHNKHGNVIKVIINTATDTPAIIANFKNFFDANGSYDFVISSIRDDNFWPRKDFFSIMMISPASKDIIELPLAKITRRGSSHRIALNWYYSKIDMMAQHILHQSPFDL